MLKYFSVENFHNFKEKVSIDFSDVAEYQYNTDCLTNGYLGKMIIYGRNATGKTNLGRAISDISGILYSHRQRDDPYLIHGGSEKKHAEFQYSFLFGENEFQYRYHKSAMDRLTWESLSMNGKEVFELDYGERRFHSLNLAVIDADGIAVNRYLDSTSLNGNDIQIPFLRWIINNAALRDDAPILNLPRFADRMYYSTGDSKASQSIDAAIELLMLNQGELKRLEDFLNQIGVPCKLRLETLADKKNELYFVYGSEKIPFREIASSGTINLFVLYSVAISANRTFAKYGGKISLLYLDEFDAFYHYELARKIVLYLKYAMPDCQVIFTTHNTNLMSNELMRPDCLFILSTEGKLTSLTHATNRELREGHNLEKLYISGEFADYE